MPAAILYAIYAFIRSVNRAAERGMTMSHRARFGQFIRKLKSWELFKDYHVDAVPMMHFPMGDAFFGLPLHAVWFNVRSSAECRDVDLDDADTRDAERHGW